jgi:hypothetical protein
VPRSSPASSRCSRSRRGCLGERGGAKARGAWGAFGSLRLGEWAGHIMRVVLASLGQRWIGPFGPFGPFGLGAVRECADGAGRGFCFRRSRQLAWASRWCCRRCPRSNGSNGSNGSSRSKVQSAERSLAVVQTRGSHHARRARFARPALDWTLWTFWTLWTRRCQGMC